MKLFRKYRLRKWKMRLAIAEGRLAHEKVMASDTGTVYPIVQSSLVSDIYEAKAMIEWLEVK